jgi:hypothetical protein
MRPGSRLEGGRRRRTSTERGCTTSTATRTTGSTGCCARTTATLKALPMPEKFVREMVADWMGAGRAITGRWDVNDWYRPNFA